MKGIDMKKNKNSNITRRKFIKVIGASSAGLMINPTLLSAAATNYSATVATATATSYDETLLKEAVEQMLDNIGGLADIIKPGDTVGIKVNLTGGSDDADSYQTTSGLHPGDTYWTNPTLLKVVGQAVKDAGASKLYILEAIYDWESVDNYGYKEVVDYLGATFIDLNYEDPYNDYIIKSVGDNSFIYPELTLNGIFNELDCFISMPKAKQHGTAGVTHGMKNLVGILPVPAGIYNSGQDYRKGIHNNGDNQRDKKDNLCRLLIDLNRAAPINLVVNDAVKTVLGSEGPWAGNHFRPATFDKLIIGKDPVAVDSVSTDVIGFDPMAADYTSPYTKSLNYLKLASEQGLGEYDLSKIEIIDNVSGIENENEVNHPNSIKLHQNYPNPFNPNTTIQFNVEKAMNVNLKVYNSQGQEVAVLFDGMASAGSHKLKWNATGYASGTYYYTINAGKFNETKRMVLVK